MEFMNLMGNNERDMIKSIGKLEKKRKKPCGAQQFEIFVIFGKYYIQFNSFVIF